MKKGLFLKIALAFASVTLALSVFGGCGKADQKIQIWAGTYWGGDNQPVLDEMVGKWNEYARANGKKEAVVTVLQDVRGSMTTGSISGRIGDIVLWDRWESLRLAYQQVLMPLDDKLAAAGYSPDDFNPSAMAETNFEGKHYGIPFDLDTWGLFVNRNYYLDWAKTADAQTANAWLVNPGKTEESVGGADSKYKYPETWTQFYAAARGCTVKDSSGNITRAGLSTDIEFVSWLSTAGGRIADLDAKKSMLYSNDTKLPGLDKTYRAAAEEVMDLWDKFLEQSTDTPEQKGEAVTAFSFFSNTGTVDYFLTGKVAFKVNSILNGMTTYQKYKEDGFEFDYIPFPSQDDADMRGGMLGGYGMSIPASAPSTDAAWELIQWWVLDDENYMGWCRISKLIPSRMSMVEKVRQDEGIMSAAPYLKLPIDNIAHYRSRPPLMAYSQYETSVQSPALDVYFRRTTPGPDSAAFHKQEFFRKIEESSDLSRL
ncbi:MAG: extracellular solute-binding protein [Clostridiales bacterium]|jgi:ABC-type glycerol-3-phosphate transport system substrate-binding protein|nr:extracellular solute-binding protein [Clostridiales bacterium]